MSEPDQIATTSWDELFNMIRPGLNGALQKVLREATQQRCDGGWLPYLLLGGHLDYTESIRHPLPKQVLNLNRPPSHRQTAFFALARRMLTGLPALCGGRLYLRCWLEGAAAPCAELSIEFEVVSEHAPYRASRSVHSQLRLSLIHI